MATTSATASARMRRGEVIARRKPVTLARNGRRASDRMAATHLSLKQRAATALCDCALPFAGQKKVAMTHPTIPGAVNGSDKVSFGPLPDWVSVHPPDESYRAPVETQETV